MAVGASATIWRRTHRKMLVVGDELACLGGFNIHRESSRMFFGDYPKLQRPKSKTRRNSGHCLTAGRRRILHRRLLKNPVMENCESFCLLVRRDEGAGSSPRLRSNEARKQKGRSPAGLFQISSGEAAHNNLKNIQNFPLRVFSTVS